MKQVKAGDVMRLTLYYNVNNTQVRVKRSIRPS